MSGIARDWRITFERVKDQSSAGGSRSPPSVLTEPRSWWNLRSLRSRSRASRSSQRTCATSRSEFEQSAVALRNTASRASLLAPGHCRKPARRSFRRSPPVVSGFSVRSGSSMIQRAKCAAPSRGAVNKMGWKSSRRPPGPPHYQQHLVCPAGFSRHGSPRGFARSPKTRTLCEKRPRQRRNSGAGLLSRSAPKRSLRRA